MELAYRYGVLTAFVENLMADRIDFSDFGSVPFSMVKTKKPNRQNLTLRRLRVTKERVENGTKGFSLITFNGVGVQIWCLHSFCSKFNGGSDRHFRF